MTGKELFSEIPGCGFWNEQPPRIKKTYEQSAKRITEKYIDNWISVEDETPEERSKYNEDFSVDVIAQTIDGISSARYYYPSKFWILDDDNINWTVKYWQPLPKARKEK